MDIMSCEHRFVVNIELTFDARGYEGKYNVNRLEIALEKYGSEVARWHMEGVVLVQQLNTVVIEMEICFTKL
jgi:hypothetical protein